MKKVHQRWLLLRELITQVYRGLDALEDYEKFPDLIKTITPKGLKELITIFGKLEENPDACLNDCKGEYFCCLKKRHKGAHKDINGFWWE